MKGMKFGGIFAVLGFLLSFISGLFSHTSILSIIIKAIIFALIFGVLGFVISFIFEKFLDDENSDNFTSDSDSGSSSNSSSSTGHVVDITIQDDELDSSDSENHYVVGDKHQMLNPSDIKNQQVDDESVEDKNGFVPLHKTENLKNLSGKEALSPEEVVENVEVNQISDSFENAMKSGIDTLPDISNLEFAEGSDSSDKDEILSTDSDFVSISSVNKKDAKVPEIKDAGLMAKAISSVLSDEES